MSTSVSSHHSGAGPLSLMSCVRESSPLQDFDSDSEKNVASKKKFWNPKKWFRRKNKAVEDVVQIEISDSEREALRSRSTSELSESEVPTRRRSGSSMLPGLSVSHDSVFHSPHSGSDMELNATQSASSLSISQPLGGLKLQVRGYLRRLLMLVSQQRSHIIEETELSERLRARRGRGDTSEDDEGLPHSPCNSPTTTDGLLDKTGIKDLPTKSHSTCSDGSLLSMGSSEIDEDSFGPQSKNSSKLSLQEKRSLDQDDLEFGLSTSVAPLNHSAAHHRVAVRPKRTHGAPRRTRGPQVAIALPATPEVNEDSSIRSITPEVLNRETVTELYSMNASKTSVIETHIKCSSLPPGLAPPTTDGKLNRSKSSVGSKSHDQFPAVEEEREEKEEKSFFDRIFTRRSAKKKKIKEEKQIKVEEAVNVNTSTSSATEYSHSLSHNTFETSYKYSNPSVKHSEPKPVPVQRSGPASRQRIQPIDLPPSPDEEQLDSLDSVSKSHLALSPLNVELENMFKQRQIASSPSKAPQITTETPPQSPKSPKGGFTTSVISKSEHAHHYTKSSFVESTEHRKDEEIKSKVKIAGLSPYQQRVLSYKEDGGDTEFKSLTDFTPHYVKSNKPITKSHSFKSSKSTGFEYDRLPTENSRNFYRKCDEKRVSVIKAASLDSIKTLDEPVALCEEELVQISRPTEFKEYKSENEDSIPPVENVKNDEEIEENFEKKTDDITYELEKGANILDTLCESSGITISGPSHTAVVNVSNEDYNTMTDVVSSREISERDGVRTVLSKESQISVTKIHLKREVTQVTQGSITLPQDAVPEFISKQLNKVEIKPKSNIILSMNSPKMVEEQIRPNNLFTIDTETNGFKPSYRKFSQENLEILDKENKEEEAESSPSTTPPESTNLSITPLQTSRFKKNYSRKSSTVSIVPDSPSPIKEKQFFKSRSVSLDSLKNDSKDNSDKSSQDSLDKDGEKLSETQSSEKSVSSSTTTVVRRRTIVSSKRDEEPELMKVFARRSLKIKDSDADIINSQSDASIEISNDLKSRDSDKENQTEPILLNEKPKEQFSSQVEFRRAPKSLSKDPEPSSEKQGDEKPQVKEPLTESVKNISKVKNEPSGDVKITMDVPLLRNGRSPYQRCASLLSAKPSEVETLKKQSSASEHRKTESWITSVAETKVGSAEKIINHLSPKNEYGETLVIERKNFNQRKAEWERRAQEAQKKNVP